MNQFNDYAKFTLISLFLMLYLGTGIAHAAPTITHNKIDTQLRDHLYDIVGDGQSVRLIVELRGAQDLDEPAALDVIRTRLAEIKDRIRSQLPAAGWQVLRPLRNLPFVAIEADQATLTQLERHPDVIGIEEDRLHKPTLNNSIPIIGADRVWSELGVTGAGQMVAVLDTGIDTSHPMFQGKTIIEACFSSAYAYHGSSSLCPNGRDEQTGPGAARACAGINGCNHGTHVASTAVGNGDAIGRPSGVAKNADLIAIQVFSRFDGVSQCGSSASCLMSYTSDQLEALNYLYELSSQYPIVAANMSLGGSLFSSAAQCEQSSAAHVAAIYRLADVGIATVIAAGNNGNPANISSPGCITGAVSVGAVTDTDQPASFSNSASWLDLWAPGYAITAAVPGGYASLSGTSMATPHVAGAFALLKEQSDISGLTNIGVEHLLAALITTGESVFDADNGMTFPRISLYHAANALSSGISPPYAFIRDNDGIGDNAIAGGIFQEVTMTDAYGGTLLRGAGNGLDSIRLAGPEEAGTFDVYAWWPALLDNSERTVFDIHHANGTDPVEVDQTINGSRWVHLGTFDLLANGSSIDISNPFGGRVAVDALLFERLQSNSTVLPTDPLLVATSSLADGQTGSFYSANLNADGGVSPYQWSLASGTLPAGINLSSAGLLSGTPQADGDFRFIVKVTDNNRTTATRQLMLQIMTAPEPAPAPTSDTIDFNRYTLESFATEDRSGTADILDGGSTVALSGNTWKRIDFPYTVTSDTIIEFDFYAEREGEVHAIGLDENNATSFNRMFKVWGTQWWGIRDFDTASAGSWTHFRIPVGQFHTGRMSYLVLAGDDDRRADSAARFRNVRIYEAGDDVPAPEPNPEPNPEPEPKPDPTPESAIDFSANTPRSFFSEDRNGTTTVVDDGATLVMTGNNWKQVDLPYNITPNTVIELDIHVASEGEVHGIGLFSNLLPSANRVFKLQGSQRWGIDDYDGIPVATWTRVKIPVGRFYTGNAHYLVFANDDDIRSNGETSFSNVKVYEQ